MNLFDDWACWQVTIPCDVCPAARNSIAGFSIELTVRSHGAFRGHVWRVCGGCLPSCVEAAYTQHVGFAPPVVKPMPAKVSEYV